MESSFYPNWTVQLRAVDAYASVFPNLSWRTRMSEQPQSPDFEALMDRVKSQRCRESFHQLFKAFFGNVVAYLKRSGLDDQRATDLAQDVFVTIWHKSELFDSSKGSFKVWMFTIVRNLKFDYLRSKQRDVLSVSSKDIYEMNDEIPDDFNHEDFVSDNEIRDRVSQLPQEQRDAVESIYLQGYSQSEYADLRNIPLGTVKSRVRLAFAQLRKRMEEK